MKGMAETIKLDGEGITRISKAARELLNEQYVDSRQATAAWLTFENDLLALRDHFGEDTEAQIILRNVLGRYRLLVKVRGERFDPRDSQKRNDWEYSVFEASGMVPGFLYLGGHNIITLTQAKKPLSSLMRIALALVLGIVASYAGNVLLSQETRTLLLESVVQPTFDLLIGMLSGLAGPLVFFAMAWGICGIGDAATIGRSGRSLIKSSFGMNAFAAALATITCLLVYGQSASASSSGGELLTDLYGMIIALIPTNPVRPFVDGNTPQIILIAVAVGVSILTIGDAVKGVRSLVREANAIIQFLMEQLCRLVPLLIFMMTVSQIWSGAFITLLTSWSPALMGVLLMCVCLLFEGALTSMHIGVPLPKLLRMCLPAITMGLTTASSSATMKEQLAVCTDELGIDEGQASFGVPLAMVLCKPAAAIEIIVLLAFAMHVYGGGGDMVWYVRLAVTAFMYAIVVPPISGGMIACFGMMLSELGIPMEALALIAALDIILDYPSTGSDVGLRIMAIARASIEKGKAKLGLAGQKNGQ